MMDEATMALHAQACPGCGCEPEVECYWRRAGVRVGYTCHCGARVIEGVIHMLGDRS